MKMQKNLLLILCLLFTFNFSSKADEGMWLPLLLKDYNYKTMKKMGLKLSSSELYNINSSSLKDAIVSFGGFCTGEVISKDGLILTNHHCGYDAIQSNSTVENDFLTNGFWAMNRGEEIPVEGLFVKFLVRIDDVTTKVLADIDPKLNYNDRKDKIREKIKALNAEAKEEGKYSTEVKEFLEGNEYYLFVYEIYNDIRMVGAPPSSIGKYGGDTDNWMWPRHTGDFSLFRVYADKDGKPSEYNIDNKPLAVKHSLPISMKGVESDDFSMVLGYPGRTQRYKTSHGIKLDLEKGNPTKIKIRHKKLAIMKRDMNRSDDVRIKYSSKYASTSNYYKYFIGQNKGLKRLKTVKLKEQEEREFQKWAEITPERKDKYASILDTIGKNYTQLNEDAVAFAYYLEAGFGSDFIMLGYRIKHLTKKLEDAKEPKEIAEIKEALLEIGAEHFKDYNLDTDREIFSSLFAMFYKDVNSINHPSFFSDVVEKHRGNFDEFAEELYNTSFLSNQKAFEFYVNNIEEKKVEKDPGVIAFNSLYEKYKEIKKTYNVSSSSIKNSMRTYIAGMREMNPDKNFYADANSTMRLTYGKVESYEPKDAVKFNYFTTIDGLMEKYDPDNKEFNLPQRLVDIYEAGDYGVYANEEGTLNICFITNNDITGGNSGSPVINGNGELIGCAFDGNWEAMTGDLVFDSSLKRCINVDARYILFIIDKFAGASHLLDEMDIRN